MPRRLFVNLAVADLPRTMGFFQALGFGFNQRFTNAQGAMMEINDGAKVMFLTKPFFQTFTPKAIADSALAAEAIVSISVDGAQAVRDLCERAFALGGRNYKEPEDHGFMYGWGFEDLDGHVFEVFWMDDARMPTGTAVS